MGRPKKKQEEYAEPKDETSARTRSMDKFLGFRKQLGLLNIREMAKEIDKEVPCDYQKLLRLSKGSIDIFIPKYRVLGSEKTFFHKDEIPAIIKEYRRSVDKGGAGLTQNDMARELGLHPSFFAKAVALNSDLKPENGEYYLKSEKARIIKLMVVRPEPTKKSGS